MVFHGAGRGLRLEERAIPAPGPGEVLLRVRACAVCRTDLHLVDGELPQAAPPVVPGHQIVGEVAVLGPGVTVPARGARVGVSWVGRTCGYCELCRSERENLCRSARFTGCNVDGGFAEYARADARWVFALPDAFDDAHAAPLLCAGPIGWRALRLAGEGARVGLYGFGAAGHLLAQVLRHQRREAYAFTRPGDEAAQQFARSLGVRWAGGSDEAPPEALDAAILFAPVGALVPVALRHVAPGGTVVCGGIHMSDVPAFPYSLLWEERVLRSVANLTRRDAEELLALAPRVPLESRVHTYRLEELPRALEDLRGGAFTGSAVVVL
jgi:propanol-preferring alcohol dehydrogenase